MKPVLLFLIRLTLAAILAWAGFLKALDPAAFSASIQGFRLVTPAVAAALALYLPWLELVLAAGLLVPRWRHGALLVTAMLFSVFTLVWILAWARGLDVACGCFGSADPASALHGLLRALAPALAAWIALRLDRPATQT